MNTNPSHATRVRPDTPSNLTASGLAAAVAPMVVEWAEVITANGLEPVVRWDETEGLTLGYLCPDCSGGALSESEAGR